jgi:hypothetical protein
VRRLRTGPTRRRRDPGHARLPQTLRYLRLRRGSGAGCAEDHALYEAKRIDLLPLLLNRGYRRELVHAIVEHDAAPMHVFEVVTGVAWEPVRQREEVERSVA